MKPRLPFRRLRDALSVALAAMLAGASVAGAVPIVVITTTGLVQTFDSATPGTLTNSVAVTGLQAGETLLGIDFRPADGQLYALGSTSRLYRLNSTTGVATQVGAAGQFALNGTAFGFDFNPVVDRIRVVSDAEQNLRLNPNDGTFACR